MRAYHGPGGEEGYAIPVLKGLSLGRGAKEETDPSVWFQTNRVTSVVSLLLRAGCFMCCSISPWEPSWGVTGAPVHKGGGWDVGQLCHLSRDAPAQGVMPVPALSPVNCLCAHHTALCAPPWRSSSPLRAGPVLCELLEIGSFIDSHDNSNQQNHILKQKMQWTEVSLLILYWGWSSGCV